MRLKSVFLLVLASFLGSLFFSCAKPETSKEVIELKLASVMPPPAALTKLMTRWADSIGEKSNGRLKITCYHGASLLKHEEIFRGVKEGIADIALYGVGEDPGILELNCFTKQPFIGYKSWKQATVIYNELLHGNKFPELMAEFENEGVKPFFCRMPPGFQLFNSKKPVRAPQDMKGLKCYTIGDLADTVKKAGGAPVDMGIMEVNMALERGLLDGVFTHFAAMKVFGLLEKQKYGTIFSEGGCYTPLNCFLINAKTWNSLPDDLQELITDSEADMLAEADEIDDVEVSDAKDISKKVGIKFIELTDQELKPWQDLAKPTVDKWISKMEAKGMGATAKALWTEVQKQIKEKK